MLILLFQVNLHDISFRMVADHFGSIPGNDMDFSDIQRTVHRDIFL
jgi:hypothetical protein